MMGNCFKFEINYMTKQLNMVVKKPKEGKTLV